MNSELYLDHMRRLIRKHGWAIQWVGETPPFAYTCGLSTRQQPLPEIVIAGVGQHVAGLILNDIAKRIIEGSLKLNPATIYTDVLDGVPVKFRYLPACWIEDRLKVVCSLQTSTPVAWQVIWPDKDGKFEGDQGVDANAVRAQNLEPLA